MLRTAPRQLLRQSTLPLAVGRRIGGIRHQSTGVPRRSFKNGVARWAIAIGGTYWYMTSPVFNDEPAYVIQESKDGSEPQIQTIASVKASSRFKPPHPEDAPVVASTPTSSSPPSINPKSPDPIDPDQPDVEAAAVVDPEHARALEQEATQQGAFNEETGEINWDCPCLGGMAYGPCGESFRDAFSCFVFSKEEPKGMDCIDRFERMQTCFREHPEIYAEEIADDERAAEFAAEEEGVARLPGPDGEAKGEAGAPAAPMKLGGPDVDQPSVWTPLPDASEGAASKGQKKTDAAAASAKSS